MNGLSVVRFLFSVDSRCGLVMVVLFSECYII